jgi:DNA-binding transcriptional LysR family regulator
MGRAREKGLESVRLCTTTPVAVASSAYLAAHPALRHPRDLAQHDCLGMTGDPGRVTWSFREGTAAIPVSVRPRLALADVTLLASLAEDGLGVCQLPEFLTASAIASGRLVEVLREFRPPDVDLFLVHQAGPHVRPALRAFVVHLQAYFAQRHEGGIPPPGAPLAG